MGNDFVPVREGRVGILTEQIKPGGKRSHIEALRAGLEGNGWDVSLLDWGMFSRVERALVAAPGYGLQRLQPALGHRWTIPAYRAVLERRLRAMVNLHRDVRVLNLNESFVVPVARRAAPRVPVALTIHGPSHREIASGYGLALDHPTIRWIRDLERQGILDADAVISVDQGHAAYARDLGRTNRVWVIPNFVDTRVFHENVVPAPLPSDSESWIAGRPVLLCPRRLVPKNGVAIAVEAAAILRGQGIRFAMVIAGDGPQRTDLNARVRRLDLDSHVRLLGSVPPLEMPGWCRRSAVVLVPSVPHKGVEEATSIAAIEGQACARPVVASAIGGLREVIEDGVTGLLVPAGDPAALAGVLEEVLANGAFAERLGAAAARHVRQHHSHDAAARSFIEVYRAIAIR